MDEDSGTFKHIVHLHSTFGQIAADPSGRYWTLGEHLFPLELSSGGQRHRN